MFQYDKGIKIKGADLWLDAVKSVHRCCVTHGHLDHAKKHGEIIATEKTIRILDHRMGKRHAISLDFNTAFEIDGCELTLFPAGHILGSAQVLVQRDGMRVLYSGDFNLEKSATAEEIEIPEADILIMECTFGKPFYQFPARTKVEEQLLSFVQDTLQQKRTPVVIGYVLGKAQEAMKILGDGGFEMAVHGSVAQLATIYEEFGVRFGHWQKFQKSELEGKVIIAPPQALKTRTLKNLPGVTTVFLSGWALHSGMKFRRGFDEALPLSDHADFDGLIEYVRKVKPKKIYTTHGFDEFPNHLRELGFDAELLKSSLQLSLF